MSKYISFYRDSACTNLWATIPVAELEYGSVDNPPLSFTIGTTTYRYFDGYGRRFRNVEMPTENPPFLTSRNTFPIATTLYCKNGLSFSITVSGDGTSNYMQISQLKAGGVTISSGQNQQDTQPIKMYLAAINYQGVTYIGFTPPRSGWSGTIQPTAFVESSFWESAIRPNYDYGSGTDEDGGQGDGKIPHSDIPLTENPRRIMPFGGHGLHAYRVNLQAYNSIQGFLWGETNTIAKSLWQKFMNHNHTPVQCIVGAYSLPDPFMPSGAAASGVQLGGTMLKPIAGSCQDVTDSIGFLTTELFTFNTAPEPFHSWLDYTGIQAILHIPFCGTIQISAEYVINRNVQFRYRVDQLNGNVVAIVYAAGRVIAEISGNCAYSVPVSGGDDGTLQRLGATLAGVLQLSAGNYAGALSSAAEAASAVHHTQIVNSDMHGSMTACENRVPYIEWIYPTTAYTPDYYKANGVPCEFSGTLSAFAGGYGEFEVLPASLNIPDATAAEKEEIAALLRGGVIV